MTVRKKGWIILNNCENEILPTYWIEEIKLADEDRQY